MFHYKGTPLLQTSVHLNLLLGLGSDSYHSNHAQRQVDQSHECTKREPDWQVSSTIDSPTNGRDKGKGCGEAMDEVVSDSDGLELDAHEFTEVRIDL